MSIRILIADDHEMFRQSLTRAISLTEDLSIYHEAADGREAVRAAAEHGFDVILMDIEMPGLNGIEATRRILKNDPEARVLALSGNTDRSVIADMLDVGAMGYVDKHGPLEELEEGIRAVARGEPYYSRAAFEVVRRHFLKSRSGAYSPLTSREREVVELVAEGKSSKELARILGISVRTADAHRRNVMLKLGTKSVAELVLYAVRNNIVFPRAK